MASIPVVDGLDIASVRLFLDVVELGSVSKAAVRHRLAQPSATARLQKLERQLGVQLLDRGADRVRRHRRPACAWRRRAPTSSPPRSRWSTAPSTVARRAASGSSSPSPATSPTTSSRAGSTAAELADVRIDLDRGRHARRRPRRALRGGRRSGSPTARRHRSGCARSSSRARRSSPVVGRRHPWFARRRAVSGQDLVGATLALPRPGSGTLDVVAAALAPFGFGDARRPHRGRQLGRGAHRRAQRGGGRLPAAVSRRRRTGARNARRRRRPRRAGSSNRCARCGADVRPPAGPARRLLAAMCCLTARPPGDGHGAGRGWLP